VAAAYAQLERITEGGALDDVDEGARDKTHLEQAELEVVFADDLEDAGGLARVEIGEGGDRHARPRVRRGLETGQDAGAASRARQAAAAMWRRGGSWAILVAMADASLVVILVIVGPLIFVGFWSAICWLIGLMSGWRALARRYSTTAQEPSVWEWTSGMVGLMSYRYTLAVGAAAEGLDLRVMSLFRPGHAPLRIPWDAVVFERTGLFGQAKVRLGGPRGPTLTIPGALWRRIEELRAS